MRVYLDTSALVKLYTSEEGSALARRCVQDAEVAVTSLLAYVEARAAFARKRRDGTFTPLEHRRAVRDLDRDWERFVRWEVTDGLVRGAAALADRHHLRAYDAVHLASATSARHEFAESLLFATWDARLEAAAGREGLPSARSRFAG